MPGLVQRNAQFGNAPASPCLTPAGAVGSASSKGIWSRHRDDITFDQLQKFWSELPPHTRQELLRIDKQTLFEQARKNLYCSRCNGLLLEGFTQIVMYGKSLQQEGGGVHLSNKNGALKDRIDKELINLQDPSVHPWGGLAATRDGALTLLDCFLFGKSLRALQNVFDSARAREHERELLYPDACGGGGRGWISQGMANYGRGHGTRETCALHTARLSCDTLVDFWSALSDETRLSLLRMKEEDFIERLMYRFDSKRFCRDCRRNVIREFKELKELKRMRREPRCTSWFCVADMAFQYEVSDDTVQADWHQSFTDTVGTYHHFEWAIGTAEGKSDILEFEDVGMNRKVQVEGLDLSGLSSCFITLRAWRLDGRCTELAVKAHAVKGEPCVHRRLVVGDGFVTITRGESIRRFFEHAEEAEEEEEDDTIDRDGNELDGDGSRPQKHAKSPELAREFLLDAATVIFKEQVEKAFREGTARQNAHSIFVCLALKLLEERVHVACKEIITLEKQIKLLEEEEKERRDEEERKERRRTKEREKKLRRKERLKGKERERELKNIDSVAIALSPSSNESSVDNQEEPPINHESGYIIGEAEDNMITSPLPFDIEDEDSSNGCMSPDIQNLNTDSPGHPRYVDGDLNARKSISSFIIEESKSTRRKLRLKKTALPDTASKWCDRKRSVLGNEGCVKHDGSDTKFHRCMMASPRCINGAQRLSSRGNILKTSSRGCGPKFSDKFHSPNSNKMHDRCDFHSCSCNHHGDYRVKDSMMRSVRENKTAYKTQCMLDSSRPFYRSGKYSIGCYVPDNCVIPTGKLVSGNNHPSRDVPHTKQVWEPTDSWKKCTRSKSDTDVTLRTNSKVDISEIVENESEQPPSILQAPEHSVNSGKAGDLSTYNSPEDSRKISNNSGSGIIKGCHNGFGLGTESHYYSKDGSNEEVESCPIMSTLHMNNSCDPDPSMSSSSSDNCSSCLSEGDSGTSSSSAQNAESSSTSDSEDASQQSEGREVLTCDENTVRTCQDSDRDRKTVMGGGNSFTSKSTTGFPAAKIIQTSDIGRPAYDRVPQQQHVLPIHNQSTNTPIFNNPSTMRYHSQSPASWLAAPTSGMVSFAPSHPCLFPRPLGYGLSVNGVNGSSDFCMQYNVLQPLANPVLNIGQLPMHQTVNQANVVYSKEQIRNCKMGGAYKVNGGTEAMAGRRPLDQSLPDRRLPLKPTSSGQNGSVVNAAKSHNDSPFSLFHFGGPMAVPMGNNLYVASPGEETTRSVSSKQTEVQSDHTCTKQEAIVEEYSLFASSNGARFSFF